MTDFRSVTPHFSVSPQLSVEDMTAAAAAGFKIIISNRPDGEDPGQLTAAEARAIAEAAGLRFEHYPFVGPPTEQAISGLSLTLAEAGPVLAFCRSGTRSITAWAIAQARSGAMNADEIIEKAAAAGYNLSGLRGSLAQS